jgi:hypothetical protein
MIKAPPGLVEPQNRAGDVICCAVLRAIYALESAQFRAQLAGRKSLRALTHVMKTFWLAGRPVLFLYLLCLVAAGLLAPIDAVPAIAFLIAGCSAVIAFVYLARPSLVDERILESGDATMGADPYGAPAPRETTNDDSDTNDHAACEEIARHPLLR